MDGCSVGSFDGEADVEGDSLFCSVGSPEIEGLLDVTVLGIVLSVGVKLG